MVLREDLSRLRKGHGAQNMATCAGPVLAEGSPSQLALGASSSSADPSGIAQPLPTARVHMLSDRHAGMFTSHHARAIVGSPYFSNSRLSASASSAACERFSFTAKMASCCRTVGSK